MLAKNKCEAVGFSRIEFKRDVGPRSIVVKSAEFDEGSVERLTVIVTCFYIFDERKRYSKPAACTMVVMVHLAHPRSLMKVFVIPETLNNSLSFLTLTIL